MRHLSVPPLLTLLLTPLGCAESSMSRGDESADYADTGWGDPMGADGDESAANEPGDADLGSEQESDFLKLLPAVTDSYVFVANPARNTLTRIGVPSLDVITVDVGVEPDQVITTADYSKAISYNKGSDDLSIVDAQTLDVYTVPVLNNLNSMTVSPDGVWAVVFHDADIEDDGGSDGTQSFNELSVVNTDSGEHFPMVVGRNPHQVKFTDDSTLALVVSDEKLALINLATGTPDRSIIEISDDLLDPPRAEELEITPDGAYAFIRQFNTADIKLVDLSSDEVTALPVAVNPTDLDLSPDGSEAVVVDRGAGQLWIYPTTNPESAIAEVIDLPENELIGSMQFSPDSSKAILYTTAASVSHYTTWDLDEPDSAESLTVRPLVKPVKSVSITPNGGGLVVFHSDDSGEDSDPAYAGKHALTLIDLDDFLDNPMILPGEPTAYAASSSGDVGYYIMDGEKTLTMVIFDALLHQDIPLKSTPVHVGVLPDTHYAYVNQEHDLGRLTFYDPVNPLEALDDVVKTITGFELNSATEHHE